jgi:hypothetical protein
MRVIAAAIAATDCASGLERMTQTAGVAHSAFRWSMRSEAS